MPQISDQVFRPDERLVVQSTAGGGYGDPLDRDPELVRWDVREGLISLKRARDVYGVVLDTQPEHYAVDHKATEKRRRRMRDKGGRS